MIQTLAIFKDAYRELNSKKLFWIVLVISGLVVALFAALGINEKGMTFFVWTIELPGVNSDVLPPAQFYKGLFKEWGIGIWLSWIASILALVSTAGMIPDFISSGSIELTLSKPIRRLRLFLVKFAAGLLFVGLQVTVFSFAAFIVIGIRGGLWEPRLFLAIPIVVCLFSYLFSICVVLGLLTRSTIASLLLTLLVWFFIFLLNAGDAIILQGKTFNEMRSERATERITTLETRAKEKWTTAGNTAAPTATDLDQSEPELPVARRELEDLESNGRKWSLANRIAVVSKTFFPKTGETVELLGRTLKSQAELDKEREKAKSLPLNARFGNPREQREVELRMEEKIRGRTVWWVLGTSLAFEFVVLSLGCVIFCRRDF